MILFHIIGAIAQDAAENNNNNISKNNKTIALVSGGREKLFCVRQSAKLSIFFIISLHCIIITLMEENYSYPLLMDPVSGSI